MLVTRMQNGKVKSRQPAQYNEDMGDILIEKQKAIYDDPKPTPIFIRKNNLIIDNDDTLKLEAMKKHPDNVANGGKMFREVDVAKEENLEIDAFEKLDEAISVVMSSTDAELRTLAIEIIGVKEIKSRTSTLKKKLRLLVQEREAVREVVINFSTEKNKIERLLTTIALGKEVIFIKDGKKIAWTDSNELIYSGSQGKDIIKEFSTWLKTDEQGREVYASLAKKLE